MEVIGTAGTHLGYTGALTDEVGLVYLHARYYNPVSGQFLSGDPLEGQAVDPRSWNRYEYVSGNPANRTDPSGRCGEAAMSLSQGLSWFPSAGAFFGTIGVGAECLVTSFQPASISAGVGIITFTQILAPFENMVGPAYQAFANQSTNNSNGTTKPKSSDGSTAQPAPTPPPPPDFSSIQRKIEAILGKFPIDSGKCSVCARQLARLFEKEGFVAQIGRIEATETKFLVTDTGIQVSNSNPPFHEFVRVGNTVWDALTGPAGMQWSDYVAKFWKNPSTYNVIKVTFSTP
jgi:RHS repeat-associated protein